MSEFISDHYGELLKAARNIVRAARKNRANKNFKDDACELVQLLAVHLLEMEVEPDNRMAFSLTWMKQQVGWQRTKFEVCTEVRSEIEYDNHDSTRRPNTTSRLIEMDTTRLIFLDGRLGGRKTRLREATEDQPVVGDQREVEVNRVEEMGFSGDQAELIIKAREARMILNEPEKVLFDLLFHEDHLMTFKQIEEMTDIPQSSVYTIYKEMKKKILAHCNQ